MERTALDKKHISKLELLVPKTRCWNRIWISSCGSISISMASHWKYLVSICCFVSACSEIFHLCVLFVVDSGIKMISWLVT